MVTDACSILYLRRVVNITAELIVNIALYNNLHIRSLNLDIKMPGQKEIRNTAALSTNLTCSSVRVSCIKIL